MKTREPQNHLLPFLHGHRKLMMPPGQIVRLEASSNYTRVYFTDHPPVLMAKVLRDYDDLLRPFGFIRTHRSHLVNLQHVRRLDERGAILMCDTSKVEVSRRKRRQLKLNFNEHHSIMQAQETFLL
jgi:two-component system LytT family response regulator